MRLAFRPPLDAAGLLAFLAARAVPGLGVRHAVERLGHDADPAALGRLCEPLRPYRAYAVHRLWASLGG